MKIVIVQYKKNKSRFKALYKDYQRKIRKSKNNIKLLKIIEFIKIVFTFKLNLSI